MKKLVIVLLISLLFVGCTNKGNHHIILKDGEKTPIINNGDTTVYNANDLLNDVIRTSSGGVIIFDLVNRLYALEGIKDVTEETEEQYQKFIADFGDDQEALNNYLKSNNLANLDELKDFLKYNIMIGNLIDHYLASNFDELVKNTNAKLIQYAKFTDENDAKAFLEAVKQGGAFVESANANKASSDGLEAFVLTEKAHIVNANLKDALLSNKEIGLSDVLKISDEATKEEAYYVINLIETDPNKFKEQMNDVLKADVKFNELLVNLLEKYHFKAYDQSINEFYQNLKGSVGN